MKRTKAVGLVVMAVFALSAVVASSASAAGPLYKVTKRICEEKLEGFASSLACENKTGAQTFKPGWVLKEIVTRLLGAGEMADVKVTGLGVFKLKYTVLTIECAQVASSPTLLLGGTPGRSHTTIHFLECKIEGRTEAQCKVRSVGASEWGLIQVKPAKDELVYIGTKTEAEKEEGPLGDLFTPEEGTAFVEIEFSGPECPTGTVSPTKVTGSVIGQVTPVNEMTKAGRLKFPATAIKPGWVWEEKGKVKEVKPSLKIFSTFTATEIGEADIELESGEEWGVTTS